MDRIGKVRCVDSMIPMKQPFEGLLTKFFHRMHLGSSIGKRKLCRSEQCLTLYAILYSGAFISTLCLTNDIKPSSTSY